MQFNPINTQCWNIVPSVGPDGDLKEQVRRDNQKHVAIAELHYDMHRVKITEPHEVEGFIKVFEKYSENSKVVGGRVHFPPQRVTDTLYGLNHNDIMVAVDIVPWRKDKVQFEGHDFKYESLRMVIEELKKIKKWMEHTQKNDDHPNWNAKQRANEKAQGFEVISTNAQLVFTVGKYVGIKCDNPACLSPHHDYEENSSSFHVCLLCGTQYKNSNVKWVPSFKLNERGEVDSGSTCCAPIGNQSTQQIFVRNEKGTRLYEYQTHGEKTLNRMTAMIHALCERLHIESGHGSVAEWAINKFAEYQAWVIRSAGNKMKFGKWSLTCVFVYLGVLNYEKYRIYQRTVWTLAEICRVGGELQNCDSHTPSTNVLDEKTRRTWNVKFKYATAETRPQLIQEYRTILKKAKLKNPRPRKSRTLSLVTVRRYAEEIKEEWGSEFQRLCGDLIIPHVDSVECQQGANKEATLLNWLEGENRTSHQITLPGGVEWKMDVDYDKGVKLNPDIGGPAFECGVRMGDLLKLVNGLNTVSTVQEACNTLRNEITTKTIQSSDGSTKPAPIVITILR